MRNFVFIVLILILYPSWSQIQYTFATDVGGTACDVSVTYSLAGTLNGKNQYTATVGPNNTEVSWDGSQWVLYINGTPYFNNSSDVGDNPPCFGIGTWNNVSTLCAGSTWDISASSGECYPYVSYTTDCGAGATVDFYYVGDFNSKYAFQVNISGTDYQVFWQAAQTRWVIRNATAPEILFTNTSDTDPEPPDENTGTWVGQNSCSGSSITGSGGDVLPVELLYFDGLRVEGKIRTEWATLTEVNNDRFDVELSFNGLDWNVVGSVSGAGTSSGKVSYEFEVADEFATSVYVRLHQYDFDGKDQIFQMIYLPKEGQLSDLQVFPNPTSDLLIFNQIVQGWVEIYSMNGKLLRKNQIHSSDHLDISDVPDGIYIIRIPEGNSMVSRRIIKGPR